MKLKPNPLIDPFGYFMALFMLPMIFQSQIITGMSGSIAGLTGSRNKGGMYLKAKPIPTNPNSGRQQATRTLLANYASNWSSVLTQQQRDAWNNYAQTHTIKNALGDDIYINGINWFVMFNTRMDDANIGWIANPPGVAAPAGLDTFECDVSALNTVDVTFTPVMPALFVMQLWQTLASTPGSTPNFNQTRLVGYSGQGVVSPWAATLPFGIASGLNCVLFGRVMDDSGQVSVALTDTDLADY